MKIGCRCGATIMDQTDENPQKGHLIPDQNLFGVWDAIDDVIDRAADGRLEGEAACHAAREIVIRSTRGMWQCRACGRVYIDGPGGELHCYVPSDTETSRNILCRRSGSASGESA